MSAPVKTIAFIDTTVQVDRCKGSNRKAQCEEILSRFGATVATGMTLVEFKAVFIQQLITIHNQLRRTGARFTQVRDSLLEKNHPQVKLRMHIFNNWLAINAGSSFEIDEAADMAYAIKARLKLEDTIPWIYQWFKGDSATVFLNKAAFGCDRAEEKPTKGTRVFASTLPKCQRGKNKTCCVERIVQNRWPSIRSRLPPLDADNPAHAQLVRASSILNEVCGVEQKQLSVDDCRSAGDALLAIEIGSMAITHSLSTNAREWQVLSDCCGVSFVHVTYAGEETHS